MISYCQLRGWRDLCEYLDNCWYKFATEDEIQSHCRKVLKNLYCPNVKVHRRFLYEQYLIQFIRYQQHPIINYQPSYYRKYKKVWGWRLCSDWESKIDYLESVVLFGDEPDIKLWEPALRNRLEQRRLRQEKIELDNQLRNLPIETRKLAAAKLSVCWRCLEPLVFLMIDCLNCGAVQE